MEPSSSQNSNITGSLALTSDVGIAVSVKKMSEPQVEKLDAHRILVTLPDNTSYEMQFSEKIPDSAELNTLISTAKNVLNILEKTLHLSDIKEAKINLQNKTVDASFDNDSEIVKDREIHQDAVGDVNNLKKDLNRWKSVASKVDRLRAEQLDSRSLDQQGIERADQSDIHSLNEIDEDQGKAKQVPASVDRQETEQSQKRAKRLPVSANKQAGKIQQFCQKMGISDGSLLSRLNSFKPVTYGQKILSILSLRSTEFSDNSHIATVHKVNSDTIEILEAVGAIGGGSVDGVTITTLTYEQFQEYINNGLVVMNHKILTKEVAKHVKEFAKHYLKPNETSYAYGRFATAPFVYSKDSEKSRLRTAHTYLKGHLMNSKGIRRSGAICSELGVEIMKLAQMSAAAKEERIDLKRLTPKQVVKKLKEWQMKGKVLNLSSEHTTPGTLVRHVTNKKLGFTCTVIVQDDAKKFSSRFKKMEAVNKRTIKTKS